MTGSTPYPPGFGAPPTPPHPSGAQPPQPPGLGSSPQWQPQPTSKAPRRGFLVPIGVGAAVLLSAAALVVSLARGGGGSSSATDETQAAAPKQIQVFVDGADRDLCQAMGPLMNESNAAGNAFQKSGEQNTPERKAATPKYIGDTYDWARRAQEVVNQHADPPRFLSRTFQRYVDDVLLYAEGLAPDRDSSAYENQIYELSIQDLAGLIGRCGELEAPWWN
jgi:hypothetical protein